MLDTCFCGSSKYPWSSYMASLGRFVFLDWTSWFGAATRTWSWSRWGGESCVLGVGAETKEVSQISKKMLSLMVLPTDKWPRRCVSFSIQFLGGNKKLAPHSRRSELSEGTKKNSLTTCSQIDALQRWLPPQEVNYLGELDWCHSGCWILQFLSPRCLLRP